MVGYLSIRGVDVYTEFKVVCSDYKDILTIPALKNIEINNWPDENGVEVDLSEPVLAGFSARLTLGCFGDRTDFERFVTHLNSEPYAVWAFGRLGIERTLRIINIDVFSARKDIRNFSVEVAIDIISANPVAAPVNTTFKPYSPIRYQIDLNDLADFGIAPLDGVNLEMEKIPSIKSNLIIENDVLSGVFYDGNYLYYEPKKVELPLLMVADSAEIFNRNYEAFVGLLTKPGLRKFSVIGGEQEYPCFYNLSKVDTLHIDDKVWFKFSITLTFIMVTVDGDELLLAAETNELIETEDGRYAIDMKPIL